MKVSEINILIYRIVEFVVGKKATRKKYLKTCAERYRQANCIYIHIPKAGGTTIANSVLGKRAGHFMAKEVKGIMGAEDYNKYFSFTVSRNPYGRIVSAYNFVKNKGGSDGGVRWESYFDDPAFESFETFVKNWLVHQDKDDINILFRPQHKFITDDAGNVIVNHIAKLEELGELKEVLQKKLGREIEFVTKNVTNYSGSKKEVDSETKDLLYNYYKEDFQLFNYPR